MGAIVWFRRASEYAIGTALVLLHLALAGRGLKLAETLRRSSERGE